MPTLDWIGKNKVINHHLDVPFKVLEKQYTYKDGKVVNDFESENKIIHGDNLEALKALLPEYEGRVKCIYIDPPYNTGNEDWVYNDNVNDPKIKKWLGEVVGQEGEDLTRHDKWLCMMYPRLKLLQKLLSDDGAIFISIDDNEQANLKLICDEIFGSSNFYGDIIWEKADSPKMDAKIFSQRFDHTLVYVNDSTKSIIKKIKTNIIPEHYNKKDENGIYYLKPLRKMGKNDSREDRPNLYYGIEAPDGTIIYPIKKDGTDGNWRWSKEKYENEKYKIEWIKTSNGWSVNTKIYAADELEIPPETIFFNKDVGSNRTAIAEIRKIFEEEKSFGTPKPTEFIKKLILLIADDDSIVLDSFAGSGTTAHSVLKLNKENSKRLKFILVEMEDYAESITAERVKRVIKGYGKDKNKTEGTGGNFSYYELGPRLLLENGFINEEVSIDKIREYIWFTETHSKITVNNNESEYFLGNNYGAAYWFYYQKDKATTLDTDFLNTIKGKYEQYIIYADICLLPKDFMQKNNIIFKKIPRDIHKF